MFSYKRIFLLALCTVPLFTAEPLPAEKYNKLWNVYSQACYGNPYVVSPQGAWGNPISGKSIILSGDSKSADIDYKEENDYQQCISALDSFDTTRTGSYKDRILQAGQDGSRSTPVFAKLAVMMKSMQNWSPINSLSNFAFSSELKLDDNKFTAVGEFAIEYCLSDNCAWTVPFLCYNLRDILDHRYNGNATTPQTQTGTGCYTVYDIWNTAYNKESVVCNSGNQSYMRQASPSTVWAVSQQQDTDEIIKMAMQTSINSVNNNSSQIANWVPATNSTRSSLFALSKLRMVMPAKGNITVDSLDRAAYSTASNGDTNRALGYVSIHGGGCVQGACALTTSGKLAAMVYSCNVTYGIQPPSILIHYMDISNYVLVEWFSKACSKQATASISDVTMRTLLEQNTDYCDAVSALYDTINKLDAVIAGVGTCQQMYDVSLTQPINSSLQQVIKLPSLWDFGPFIVDDDKFDTKIFEIKDVVRERSATCFSELDEYSKEHNIDQYTMANTGRTVSKPMSAYAVGSIQANLLGDHIIDVVISNLVANKADIISDLLTTASKRYKGATYTENILALISTTTVLAAMVSVDQYQLAQRNLSRIKCPTSSWKCYISAMLLIGLMALAAAGAPVATLVNNIVAANDDTINFTELPRTGVLNTGNGTSVYMYGTNQVHMVYTPPNYKFSIWWSGTLIFIVGLTTLTRVMAMLLDSKNSYRTLSAERSTSDGMLIGAAGVQMVNVSTQ